MQKWMRLCLFLFLFGLFALLHPPRINAAPITGRIGLGTWVTQAEFKDIKVTKAGRTLFASDFTKGLDGWQILRGKWETADGVLRQTSNEQDTRIMVGDPSWSDYTLTLKARKVGGNEGFLILFAMPETGTRTWWNIGGWGNTEHAIEAPGVEGKRVRGSIETGRWYDIRIELRDNTIRGYLDNRLIQTVIQTPETHTLVFRTNAPGQKKDIPRWGLDTSWPSEDNMRRGMLYMGQEQVKLVRVAFPANAPLVDGDLTPAKKGELDTRIKIARMAGNLPWTMMPDTEAGVDPWFKKGNEVIPERWVALITAAQRHYGKKLEMVEAFNEPDYGWNQGTKQNLSDILGLLRQSPDFSGVQLAGPSTLSDDSALSWYIPLKGALNVGTTHALAGNMTHYIEFYQMAAKNGLIPFHPEVHNLAEVISGAQYGLNGAIWWGTAELARGEFVKAVHGQRLAYAEDRSRWSSACVYRTPEGSLQAFVGSSERQGEATTYRFVCQDRPVFFNGEGPQREFAFRVRRNGEYVVNITWGADIAPKLAGRYVLVNRATGKALGVVGASTANGADVEQSDYRRTENQQWDVAPYVGLYGDQTYFTIRAVHSGKALDTAGWNQDEGGRIQQWGDGESGAQNWYFEYAGDNNFYIRSRSSTKCLTPVGGSSATGAAIVQTERKGPTEQWRLIPVSAMQGTAIDFIPPQQPTGLTAIIGSQGVALEWAANRETDTGSYTVFRATKPGGPYDTIARDVRTNQFLDREAKASGQYYYAVKAVDQCGNRSAFSAEARAIKAPRK